MDPDQEEDDIVNWFVKTSDTKARQQLLRRIFNTLPTSDFPRCLSIISKCKKGRKKVAEEAPTKGLPSVQGNLSARQPLAGGWMSAFTKEQVVGIDVEKVQIPLKAPIGKKKMEQQAAIISVVDHDGNEIFRRKLFRPKDSYYVDHHTIAINGITRTTLQEPDCVQPEEVYSSLKNLLQGKLVIGLDLENDFNSFDDVAMGEFDTFDIQNHYFRLQDSPLGKQYIEKLSLRAICFHIFHIDMQPRGYAHDAKIDALWTVKAFLEHYCKIEPSPLEKTNYLGTNEIKSRF